MSSVKWKSKDIKGVIIFHSTEFWKCDFLQFRSKRKTFCLIFILKKSRKVKILKVGPVALCRYIIFEEKTLLWSYFENLSLCTFSMNF